MFLDSQCGQFARLVDDQVRTVWPHATCKSATLKHAAQGRDRNAFAISDCPTLMGRKCNEDIARPHRIAGSVLTGVASLDTVSTALRAAHPVKNCPSPCLAKTGVFAAAPV